MACTPYMECNKREGWESLFKRLIVEQEDGSLAIRGCCDGESLGCEPYVDCDHRHGWQGLFKSIVVMRADDTFAIRACG